MTANSKNKSKLSILDYVFAILFVLFAVVQYNDPDGLLWGGVYLVIALVCVLYNRIPMLILNIIILGFLIALVSYLPPLLSWIKDGMPSVVESMKAESPYIEMVREAGGLLIGLLILIYCRFKASK